MSDKIKITENFREMVDTAAHYAGFPRPIIDTIRVSHRHVAPNELIIQWDILPNDRRGKAKIGYMFLEQCELPPKTLYVLIRRFFIEAAYKRWGLKPPNGGTDEGRELYGDIHEEEYNVIYRYEDSIGFKGVNNGLNGIKPV